MFTRFDTIHERDGGAENGNTGKTVQKCNIFDSMGTPGSILVAIYWSPMTDNISHHMYI